MSTTTVDPEQPGPLDRATAEALLARADELLALSQFQPALALYGRVIGHPDAPVTAAALFGSGECLYRLDQDGQALAQWQAVTRLPETPSTYPAWRQVAAALVRAGELRRALDAYREAEKRAPAADKAEIAARLGWLSKELGDQRAAGRYFARSRGADAIPFATYGAIGVTVVVSVLAFPQVGDSALMGLLELNKAALAAGEWWRLVSPVLVHVNLIHLLFNMYALWIFGPLVEQMYGPWRFLLIYVLTAAAGSAASYLFGGHVSSVGASGAVFGLLGVLLAVSRAHRPVMDRRARMIMGQIGGIVAINLFFGFVVPGIDNMAHMGGLVAGLWLGFVMPPVRVETLASYWRVARTPGQAPDPLVAGDRRVIALARAAAILLVPIVVIAGVLLGAGAYR